MLTLYKHFDSHYTNDFANLSVYYQWKQIYLLSNLCNTLCALIFLFHFQTNHFKENSLKTCLKYP